MVTRSGNYHAFLLRIWRDAEDSPWRAMLENPHTGETVGFASMTQLYAFLEDQVLIGRSQPDGQRKRPPQQR